MREKDEIRTRELLKYGVTILRFNNLDILNNIEGVYAVIRKVIEEKRKDPPQPTFSPKGRRIEAKNVFITGLPGVGKTTLVLKVSQGLNEKIGGFYTTEIREKGKRTGFLITDFSGNSMIFAQKGLKSQYKLKDYGIDIDALNEIGVKAMLEALNSENKKIIVIDEIGKMECFSSLFKETLLKCLDSNKKVLATIRFHPDSFIDKIKKYKNSHLITLTRENYLNVETEILSWLKEGL